MLCECLAQRLVNSGSKLRRQRCASLAFDPIRKARNDRNSTSVITIDAIASSLEGETYHFDMLMSDAVIKTRLRLKFDNTASGDVRHQSTMPASAAFLLRRLRIASFTSTRSSNSDQQIPHGTPLKIMLLDLTLKTVMSRHIQLVDFAATIYVRTNFRLIYV